MGRLAGVPAVALVDSGCEAPVRHQGLLRVHRPKSGTLVDPNDGELKGHVAALAGAGIDPAPNVRIEVNGGFFDRGYNELQDVQTEKVQLFGASAQVSINDGMPVRSSVDYRLYKYNGERVSPLFNQEKYPGGLQWLAQAEVTMLGQTLKSPARSARP